MSRTPSLPRIAVSLSIYEISAMHCMFMLAQMFTRPAELTKVKAVLARIEKKLAALGVPPDVIAKVVTL